MSEKVDIGGAIVIDTSSLDKALASIQKLEKILSRASEGMLKSTSGVDKALADQTKTYSKLVAEYGKTQNFTKAEAAQIRMNNALAKAASSIGSFESQVRKTNTTSAEQSKFIAQAAQAMDAYTRGVAKSQAQGLGFAKANTELSVTLSQLQRDLAGVRQAGSQGIVDIRAIDNAKISYEKAANAVRTSALEDDKKAAALRNLKSSFEQVQMTVNQFGIRSIQATQAQGDLRKAIAQTTIATQNANKAFKGGQIDDMAVKFRNLTSSVVLALGALSGVAARLVALQGLFNRNAAVVAILLASFTAFSVALGRAKTAAMEAERQFFALDATINAIGVSSRVTSNELFDMGHTIADATLLSAKEARDAAQALVQFGNLSTEQFERVIITAQGMTSALGGRLRENVKLLGRAMREPIESFAELEQRGVMLDQATKELVTTLSQQGRETEAVNILLDQLAKFEAAARREADSLAGAVDAVSGNLDKFYENAFIASGALESAKVQTQAFAAALLELSESDAGARLGAAFNAMVNILGEAANFLIRNLDRVAAIVAFMVASTLPALVRIFTRLSVAVLGAAKSKVEYAKAATSADIAGKRLIATNNLLSRTLYRTPWGMILGLIGSAIYLFMDFDKKASNLNNTLRSITNDVDLLAEAFGILGENANIEFKTEFQRLNKDVERSNASLEVQKAELERLQKAYKDASSEAGFFRGVMRSTQDSIEAYAAKKTAEDAMNRQLRVVEIFTNTAQNAADAVLNFLLENEKLTESEKEQARAVMAKTKAQEDFMKVALGIDPYASKVNGIIEQMDELRNRLIAVGQTQNMVFSPEQLDAYFKAMAILNEQLEEARKPKKTPKTKSESTSDLDRLISTYKDLGREIEIAALKAQGLDEAIKAKEMQNRIDDLATSVSALSQEHLTRLAAQLGVNTSGMGSHAERVAAVTAEYAKLMDEIERFNTETDINNRITEITRAFESESEGVIRVYEERNREIAELEALRPEFAAEANRLRILNEEETYQRLREIREQDWLDNLNYWEKWSLNAEENLWNFQELATSTMTLVSSQFGSAMESMIFDATSFGDAMYKMAESILRSVVNAIGQMIGEWAMYHLVQKSMQRVAAMAAAKSTIGQAISQHQMAALNAYASTAAIPIVGPSLAPAAAASALAATSGFVSGIISSASSIAGFNTGGMVYGAGGDKDDKVLARLSPNEYVVQASAVKKLGTGVMNSINQGVLPNGGSNVVVNIIDQRSGDTSPIETSESVDPNGIRQIQVIVRDAVRKELAGGSLDQMMSKNYGIARKGIKR